MIVSPHEQANNPTSRGPPTQKTEPKIPQSFLILEHTVLKSLFLH